MVLSRTGRVHPSKRNLKAGCHARLSFLFTAPRASERRARPVHDLAAAGRAARCSLGRAARTVAVHIRPRITHRTLDVAPTSSRAEVTSRLRQFSSALRTNSLARVTARLHCQPGCLLARHVAPGVCAPALADGSQMMLGENDI